MKKPICLNEEISNLISNAKEALETSFRLAVELGHDIIVEQMLTEHPDLYQLQHIYNDFPNSSEIKLNMLHVAVRRGHVKTALILYKHHPGLAEENDQIIEGECPLTLEDLDSKNSLRHHAGHLYHSCNQLREYLKKNRTCPMTRLALSEKEMVSGCMAPEYTPRHYAMLQENVQLLQALKPTDVHFPSLLLFAVHLSNEQAVEALLPLYDLSIPEHQKAIQRAVYISTEKQQYRLLSLIAPHYAELGVINKESRCGKRILHIAVRNGDPLCLQILRNNGAVCDPTSLALCSTHLHQIKSLLTSLLNEPLSLYRPSTQEQYHLLTYAANHNKAQLLKFIIAQGWNLNLDLQNGITACILAARKGHLDCLELLIRAGADVNKRETSYARTALIEAAQQGHTQCVRSLLINNADHNLKDSGGGTPLIFAAEVGHKACTKILLEHQENIDEPNNYGETALYAACHGGNPDCVSLLIQAGADINAQNTYNETSFLLGPHPHISKTTRPHRTPLIIAAIIKHPECIKLLLNAGARTDILDAQGRSALSLAEEISAKECIQLLQNSDQKASTPSPANAGL